MKLLSSAIFACLLLTAGVFAQTPSPTVSPGDDGDIVKISTSLIQVDVTVVDKKGNQVTDLKPEDFEVRENGKVRQITNFSYVSILREGEGPGKEKGKTPVSRIPPVSIKLRPEQVRRTIVLVVDDLGLSFSSMYQVREGLKKFVNEQMQPDDLVAIVRTGTGVGSLQQFTSDKRLLHAAISRLKWNIAGRTGLTTFEAIQPSIKDLIEAKGGTTLGNEKDKENEKKTREFREDMYSIATLGSLGQIIASLDTMPGRKGIILLSDGLKMNLETQEQLKHLLDRANRAGVVINTVDAKGMDDAGFLGPENDTATMTFEKMDALQGERRTEFFRQSEALNYLAYGTGGRSVRNTNDLGVAVERILRSESGYYLIAYEPDDATFDPKVSKFNSLDVKIKRPDVSVRYRSGFFGITDSDLKKNATSTRQQLATALTSPFAAKDIEIRLTSIFATDEKAGDYSRAILHIDTNAIEMTDEPGNTKKISFDIYAYVFSADGKPIKQLSKNYEFVIRKDSVARMNEKGIIFPMNVPIEKPGVYQLRMAVRDTKSGKIGSASQFIEVPNLKKDRLSLSGLLIQNLTQEQLKSGQVGDSISLLYDTATRTFKRGTHLVYNFAIYNARAVKGTADTCLATYARLFRDGKLVFESEPIAVKTEGQTGIDQLESRGVLTLGSDLAPGDYILQIVATDMLAKEKNQIAAQSIDFEVIQ